MSCVNQQKEWKVLTVTFKWLHDFNYSFDNKQPCDVYSTKAWAHYGICSWIRALFPAFRNFKETNGNGLKTLQQSPTYQKNLKGKVGSITEWKEK